MKTALDVATHDWRSKPPGVLSQRGFILQPKVGAMVHTSRNLKTTGPQRGSILQPKVGPSAGLPWALPPRGSIPARPEPLPQRGFILQPRVGPSAGLPWALPPRGFIPTGPESLPQRGFILQPRVGPSAGLRWVTVTPVTNPIGVVADETSSLAGIVRVEMEGGK